MKNKASILLAVCAFALGACDHYSEKMASMPEFSPASIEPAAGVASGIDVNRPFSNEKTFADYLKEGYMVQARLEQSAYDYKNAKYFTEKAYALSNGQLVAPASVNSPDINTEDRAILSQAREELIEAIKTYNIPENRFNLADAQVNFDCWVDHATEEKKNSPCQSGFVRAMDSLITPDFKETSYPIRFDAPSGQLSESDKDNMRQVLESYQSHADYIYQIQISSENTPEAIKQVSALKSILQYNGIPQHKITHAVTKEDKNLEITVQQKSKATINTPVEARIYEREYSTTVLQNQESFY